jgi:DNA-binding transcriptional MerR regulator
MPPTAGDLAAEFGINLDTLRWCLNATTHIHGTYFPNPLEDNSLLSYPEGEAVREQFGHLTGIEIEIEYAQRLFHPDTAAQDELARLITTYEAAERCGVAESTIRVWVHRKKLTPVEYRELYPGGPRMAVFKQIDVHRANEASKAKAAAVTRQPQPRYSDRNEALSQLTTAVATCLKAGITDIPALVQQIIDDVETDQH